MARRWTAHHGVPKQWHSDQGPEFESALMQRLCKMLEMTKIRTTLCRPQSDGQVERFNRTLLNLLLAFVNEKANDWDEHIPYLMMAYRSGRHASTRCSPFAILYGWESTMPIDLVFPDKKDLIPSNDKNTLCGPEYVEYIIQMIQVMQDFG